MEASRRLQTLFHICDTFSFGFLLNVNSIIIFFLLKIHFGLLSPGRPSAIASLASPSPPNSHICIYCVFNLSWWRPHCQPPVQPRLAASWLTTPHLIALLPHIHLNVYSIFIFIGDALSFKTMKTIFFLHNFFFFSANNLNFNVYLIENNIMCFFFLSSDEVKCRQI